MADCFQKKVTFYESFFFLNTERSFDTLLRFCDVIFYQILPRNVKNVIRTIGNCSIDNINKYLVPALLKFMIFKKATKNDEIFTVDLTLCSKCQIDGEDLINFCGLLRKHEL